MIRFEDVAVRFDDRREPVLRGVDLRVDEGEMVLVVGSTGSGKSTLLRCVNGLVPHFSGGTLSGRITVGGRDTRTHRPRDLADIVGVVGQDPAAAFVTDTVEEELAYGMESLGVTGDVMRRRVEETLDLLGLADVRQRTLRTLSGGQQQRVAIGGVLAAHPRILVLDEPTSALDPAAAEDVLAALTRLVHDLGMTVLLAEHRLERVVQYADRVISIASDGTTVDGAPAAVLADSVVAPPIVELARLAAWHPVPLSVRDARRRAAPLRELLVGSKANRHPSAAGDQVVRKSPVRAAAPPITVLAARGVHVRYGRTHAVRGIDLTLSSGQVVALMGRNGSGKSSLLWALQGSGPRTAGQVLIVGPPGAAAKADPASMRPRDARLRVALVPQNPQDLLYLDTVAAECAAADAQIGAEPGATRTLLDGLTTGVPDPAHPRDLSEGQRLALV